MTYQSSIISPISNVYIHQNCFIIPIRFIINFNVTMFFFKQKPTFTQFTFSCNIFKK